MACRGRTVNGQDVMARFGVGRTVGYRRLRALVEHGLLTRMRLVYGQPAAYVATSEALAWAGLSQLDLPRVARGDGLPPATPPAAQPWPLVSERMPRPG